MSARFIKDGEVLYYECMGCGHNFERMVGYGGICPNEWTRKKVLETYPTVCPKCKSHDVERIRDKTLKTLIFKCEGRKIEDWED